MEYYHEKVETEGKIPARIYYGGTNLDKLRYPLHWHHNLEFDLVLEGCIRGKISGRPVEAHEGEIFFVNSGELHETDASGCAVMRSVTILLSDELLREYCPDLDLWQFAFEKGSSQQKRLAGHIRRCAEIHRKKYDYYELDLDVELRRICGILLKECRRKKQTTPEETGDWRGIRRVKSAISYMEQHYDSTLSLTEIANVIGMTPSYFSRFFKQATGQNFHSYLTWIRLRHAQQILQEQDETVTEIAMNNGFPNVKAFIQAFKEEYGMTPAVYRKEWERCRKAETQSENTAG